VYASDAVIANDRAMMNNGSTPAADPVVNHTMMPPPQPMMASNSETQRTSEREVGIANPKGE
jgi:hypothetical protein